MDLNQGVQHTKAMTNNRVSAMKDSRQQVLSGGKSSANTGKRSTGHKAGAFLTHSQVEQNLSKNSEPMISKTGNNWNHTSKAAQRVGFLLD